MLVLVLVVAIAVLGGGSGQEKVTATLKRFQSLMRTGDPEACRLLTASERKAAAAQADAADCADGVAKLDDGVGHVLRDFASAPVRDLRVSGDAATAAFLLPAKRLDRSAAAPLATELRRSGSGWLISKMPGLRPPGAPIDEEGL